MPKKRFSAEQIVTLLRQIEVSIAQVCACVVRGELLFLALRVRSDPWPKRSLSDA